jgi:serine/threonine protein kinase
MPLTPGMTLLNKYHILKPIGEGGMARVWLAEEMAPGNRIFAIKEPFCDLPTGDRLELQRRFQQELAICNELEKMGTPYIVRSYSELSHDDFLVMEYMPGGNLAQRIKMHPNGMLVHEVVAITRTLLTALKAVHSHGWEIVHRDITPSNILFDEAGVAHLADFGVAQVVEPTQWRTQCRAGSHPGRIPYKAPEASVPNDLTKAADLYSLGCVIFEMVTGQRYKTSETSLQWNSLRQDVPDWLNKLVRKALSNDPKDRYQNAVEMLADLRSVVDPVEPVPVQISPVLATPPPSVQPPPASLPRYLAVLVAILTLLVVVLLSFTLYREWGQLPIAALPEEPIHAATSMSTPVAIADVQGNLPPGENVSVTPTPIPQRGSTDLPQEAQPPVTTPTQGEFKPVTGGNVSSVQGRSTPLDPPPAPELNGNIVVCVPPDVASRSVIHLWRLSAEMVWEKLEKVSVGVVDADGRRTIPGLPIDATSWGAKGQPYRLELWVNSEPVKSFGNTDKDEAEFRVYQDTDNIAPNNAFCNE